VALVFDEAELRKHAPRHADAFGVTVFVGRTRSVLVSIPRVRSMISTRGRPIDRGNAMGLDAAVGRALGRVVAHEIGHVLLLSTSHAATGLMTPSLQERYVGPFDPAFFALSAADRARLAMRFAAAVPTGPGVSAPVTAMARGAGPDGATLAPVMFRDAP
jgi:hypothetical protein